MNCMKCGREVENGGVFCRSCRDDMERHPIPAGTALVLPEKNNLPPQRRVPAKKKEPAPEEQVKRLQGVIRRLTAALVCALLVVALFAGTALFRIFTQPRDKNDDIGKNYGTMAPEDTT